MLVCGLVVTLNLVVGVIGVPTQNTPVDVCKTGQYSELTPVLINYKPAKDFCAIFHKPTCSNKVKRTPTRPSTTTTTRRPTTAPVKDAGKALSSLKVLAASAIKTLCSCIQTQPPCTTTSTPITTSAAPAATSDTCSSEQLNFCTSSVAGCDSCDIRLDGRTPVCHQAIYICPTPSCTTDADCLLVQESPGSFLDTCIKNNGQFDGADFCVQQPTYCTRSASCPQQNVATRRDMEFERVFGRRASLL